MLRRYGRLRRYVRLPTPLGGFRGGELPARAWQTPALFATSV